MFLRRHTMMVTKMTKRTPAIMRMVVGFIENFSLELCEKGIVRKGYWLKRPRIQKQSAGKRRQGTQRVEKAASKKAMCKPCNCGSRRQLSTGRRSSCFLAT